MNSYELTVILPGDAGAAKVKSFNQFLEKAVDSLKGKLVKASEWGKINLFYPIKKNKEGNFLYFELELEPTSVKQLSDKFRLEDDIIRYLLIKSER